MGECLHKDLKLSILTKSHNVAAGQIRLCSLSSKVCQGMYGYSSGMVIKWVIIEFWLLFVFSVLDSLDKLKSQLWFPHLLVYVS